MFVCVVLSSVVEIFILLSGKFRTWDKKCIRKKLNEMKWNKKLSVLFQVDNLLSDITTLKKHDSSKLEYYLLSIQNDVVIYKAGTIIIHV